MEGEGHVMRASPSDVKASGPERCRGKQWQSDARADGWRDAGLATRRCEERVDKTVILKTRRRYYPFSETH